MEKEKKGIPKGKKKIREFSRGKGKKGNSRGEEGIPKGAAQQILELHPQPCPPRVDNSVFMALLSNKVYGTSGTHWGKMLIPFMNF